MKVTSQTNRHFLSFVAFVALFTFLINPSAGSYGLAQDSTITKAADIGKDSPRGVHVSPRYFIPNMGQLDSPAQFKANIPGGNLFFFDNEVALEIGYSTPSAMLKKEELPSPHQTASASLRIHFIKANPTPEIAGSEMLPGVVNYFVGNDSARWVTNIPTYAGIYYHNLYQGIDLSYSNTLEGLKGTYLIMPGADPSLITWEYTGASKVSLNSNGNLSIGPLIFNGEMEGEYPQIYITEGIPMAWQDINGQRSPIDVRYALAGKRLSFVIGEYNKAFPLVIDPMLSFSTFIGGEDEDNSQAVAIDHWKNIYVTGWTASQGNEDVYVMKYSADGKSLIYTTFLAGNSYEHPYGIAVDDVGNAVVTGITYSTDFPTKNPIQADCAGDSCGDAFITKLNSSGNELVFSTFLGGSDNEDVGYDIVLDDIGNALIAGYSNSNDFPYTRTLGSCSLNENRNAFILKITSDGESLEYNACMGGTFHDVADGIDLDDAGNIYFTGYTSSSDFPTHNAFQPNLGGYTDAFLVKLNPDGNAILYSTYLGGSNDDYGYDIGVDNAGNVYVIGEAMSDNFPTHAAIQPSYPPNNPESVPDAAFITKFAPDGQSLIYSTYLGGVGGSTGYSMDVDSSGNAYIVGIAGKGFPLVNPLQCAQAKFDAFITKMNPAGSALLFSTYLGGSLYEDRAYGIVVDDQDNAYVVGITGSADFPTINAVQPIAGGRQDGWLAKISPEISTVKQTVPYTDSLVTIYLPVIMKPMLPFGSLYGHVTHKGNNKQCLSLSLLHYDGTTWATLAGTVTDPNGNYTFNNMPGLTSGQKYSAYFQNTLENYDMLGAWSTKQLTSYAAHSDVFLGDFDVENVLYISPDYGQTVTLPRNFNWYVRTSMSSDNYEYYLFSKSDTNLWFTSGKLGYVGKYQLLKLPTGFSYGPGYYWNIWIYDPYGGSGRALEDYEVFFKKAGTFSELDINPTGFY